MAMLPLGTILRFLDSYDRGRVVYRCPAGCKFDVSVTTMERLANNPVCHICERYSYTQFKKIRIVEIPEE